MISNQKNYGNPKKIRRLEDLYAEREPSKEIWISALVVCPYKAYLKSVKPRREPHSAYSLAGIFLHEILQEQYSESYEVEKKVELDLEDGWKLVGRVDLFDALDNCVIEIKAGFEDSVIRKEWVYQTNLYSYLLKCERFEIWLVRIPDGTIERREYTLHEKNAEKWIDTARKVIQGEKIVNRQEKCKWCPYQDLCVDI